MADDLKPGLEGVIAFESEIAEPDKEGSALRYRGVDIDDLVGRVTFGMFGDYSLMMNLTQVFHLPNLFRSRFTREMCALMCNLQLRCLLQHGV